MTELKRSFRSIDEESLGSIASKRQKIDFSMSKKERKENLSEGIAALQQLVSPYGKTDTASVLLEAMDYIKFLHDQLKVLSAPYLHNTTVMKMEGPGGQYSLRSQGLCLVPVSCTEGLARNNGADIWAPIKSSSPRF